MTHKNTFTGLENLVKEYNLTLRSDVAPVVHATRQVHIALRDKLKASLDELVRNNAISPVKEPSD